MNGVVLKFPLWGAVGVLFMVGCVAPVGFVIWIPAAVLALILITVGNRSVRPMFFGFVAGIGVTLIVVGILNTIYLPASFLGLFLIAGSVTGFVAFGPRVSHAEPPLPVKSDED
ncbi:MAG: hypothetical protein M3Y45_05000 [Actinomycetota bacterium]|nr:hypothetical protein [Actinomycetota bacterium]